MYEALYCHTIIFCGYVAVPYLTVQPIPVSARYKALVCGRSVAGIVVSNPAGAWLFVCRECCVLSASG